MNRRGYLRHEPGTNIQLVAQLHEDKKRSTYTGWV